MKHWHLTLVFGTTDFCKCITSLSHCHQFSYSMQPGLVSVQQLSAPPGSRGSDADDSTCVSLRRCRETLLSTRQDCLAHTIAPAPGKTHRCGSLCSRDYKQQQMTSAMKSLSAADLRIIFSLLLVQLKSEAVVTQREKYAGR